ncbi:BolA family protein [Pelistega ratti]|uniref:BolA family protein n=1 Tax=Pelistega ratti TaxID=2652177 RepID=UPI001356D7A9|nr:BolA family protein [Pelistega ratti]
MAENRTELIRERLQQLNPQTLIIEDQSHLHAGHAANREGASHFKVCIASTQFKGLNKIAQQRLVYATVADLMPYPIHALVLETQVPQD